MSWRVLRVLLCSELSAMSALNASAQRGQDDMRGSAGRARIETHYPAKHSADELELCEKLACRTGHRLSSQRYGWRTRTAGLQPTKELRLPSMRRHLPHCHPIIPAAVRLESPFGTTSLRRGGGSAARPIRSEKRTFLTALDNFHYGRIRLRSTVAAPQVPAARRNRRMTIEIAWRDR